MKDYSKLIRHWSCKWCYVICSAPQEYLPKSFPDTCGNCVDPKITFRTQLRAAQEADKQVRSFISKWMDKLWKRSNDE